LRGGAGKRGKISTNKGGGKRDHESAKTNQEGREDKDEVTNNKKVKRGNRLVERGKRAKTVFTRRLKVNTVFYGGEREEQKSIA